MLTRHKKKLFLHVHGEKIALDTRGESSFISHAHSDHAQGMKKLPRVIASKDTLDLMEARGYAKADLKERLWKPKEFKAELVNAGHILGSTQLHVENSFSFTYTGDFKLQDSLTQKGAQVPQADVLVMEATFGSPEYKFPSHGQVYADMEKWVSKEEKQGSSVVLGGYALGKAQELVKFYNEFLGVAPVVSSDIYKICQLYNKSGIRLHAISETSDEGKAMLAKQFHAVMPYHMATSRTASRLSSYYSRKVKCAVATGWAVTGMAANADMAFPLSDHEDFEGLIDYVERSGAKRIVALHGHAPKFARHLRSLGYNATTLEGVSETPSLLEY